MTTDARGMRQPRITSKKSPGWIWFFVVLGCLTALASGLGVWYNLSQLLRPEQLAEARGLWHEKGPATYRADFTLKDQDGKEDRYTAAVANGKLISVSRGGGRTLDPSQYLFGSMDELFDYIDTQLQTDAHSSRPRVFATAVFDRRDGHVLRYVRSLRSPRERLEVIVNLRTNDE